MKKQLKTEFVVFAISLLVAAILEMYLRKKTKVQENLEFYLPWILAYYRFFCIWVYAYFFINVLRQFLLKFNYQVCNTMLLISAMLLLIVNYTTMSILSYSGTVKTEKGWMVYPPLSALPNPSPAHQAEIDTLKNIYWLEEIGLCLLVLFVLYKMYQNRRRLKASVQE